MLSQALMDRLGREATRMQGTRMETLTYHARATAQATPVDYVVQGRFRSYRLEVLTLEAFQLTDEECLLRTALVTWTPNNRYDTITRDDGTLWKVMSTRGGRGVPHWLLQCRQTG